MIHKRDRQQIIDLYSQNQVTLPKITMYFCLLESSIKLQKKLTHAHKGTVFEFDHSNAGQKPAEGWFWSKWVYNFLPAKNLYTYHVGGGQQQKICTKSFQPQPNFFCRLGNFFVLIYSDEQ